VTTQTMASHRTPDEIYSELQALPYTPLGANPTLAESIAWAEGGIQFYAAERALWDELGKSLLADTAALVPWQYAAVAGARTNAVEQEWKMRERLNDYREKEARLRDLPMKEEK